MLRRGLDLRSLLCGLAHDPWMKSTTRVFIYIYLLKRTIFWGKLKTKTTDFKSRQSRFKVMKGIKSTYIEN